MQYKIGDLVKEINARYGTKDIYGKVFKVDNEEGTVWCYWRNTIEEAKKAKKGNDASLDFHDIILIKDTIKVIKEYGIVNFMRQTNAI